MKQNLGKIFEAQKQAVGATAYEDVRATVANQNGFNQNRLILRIYRPTIYILSFSKTHNFIDIESNHVGTVSVLI